jgi:hypothetical protein
MAPAIQAQWLKTSGITVRHLLWLLLALTHVAFAIEATERLAELNRTCTAAARLPSQRVPIWGWGAPGLYRVDGEHFEPSTGAIRQGNPVPRLKNRNGPAGTIRPGRSVCTMP